MSVKTFSGSFTQQEPIPEAAIEAAVAVLRSGRLHRYNTDPNETSQTALLEREYADWQGAPYCLAVTSGGQAMQIAMRASGVKAGDLVLTNAFTLAPVPGAIEAVGARSVLVEVDENLRIDIDDLAAKIETSGARFLLLSHMRGHLCDMDRLMAVTDAAGVKVIEDCAHTMGAKWGTTRSGNFGVTGCFSAQTYKHINSGEGGFLTTRDPDVMARAVILSGSYMLYERHGAAPEAEAFAQIRLETPNLSARMDNLRAAILRPQLKLIDQNAERWNARYRAVENALAAEPALQTPRRPQAEYMVASSIQFRIPGFGEAECVDFVARAAARGVELKWFGSDDPKGFTSNHTSWRYGPPQSLPRSDEILSTLFDMRLPLTFSTEDCTLIGEILCEVYSAT